jgi:cytochrome c-type biogenesis protein CcmH
MDRWRAAGASRNDLRITSSATLSRSGGGEKKHFLSLRGGETGWGSNSRDHFIPDTPHPGQESAGIVYFAEIAPTRAWLVCTARWLLIVQLFASLCAFAQPIDPAHADRYHALIEELRCLVCQNESLAESNAELAQDLRAQVREMMEQGATNEEIVDFLVARYGDFVLYRPPFKPVTYLLWIAPFLLALAGLAVLAYQIRRRAARPEPPLSSQEQRRLRDLLGDRPRS